MTTLVVEPVVNRLVLELERPVTIAVEIPRVTLIAAAEQGPMGPPGPAGSSVQFVHTQSAPASTWSVNHNLGFRPDVTVYSLGGRETIADVLHLNDNQVEIYFAAPAAGAARCE